MSDETQKDVPQEAEVAKEEAPAVEEKKEEAPAPKAEEKKEEGEDVVVPAKFKKIVDEVEKLAVLDLHELVKLLEKKWGVSAQASVVAGPAAGGDDAEEKSDFTVELTSFGEAKIPVMKAVKEVLGLGLKEAKDLVEGAPSTLKEGAKKEEAEEIKKKVEDAGGKVTLK